MAKNPSPIIDDPLTWLLSPENPSVRYFTLAKLLEHPFEDLDVQEAQGAIMESQPVQAILGMQDAEGWWDSHVSPLNPMYCGTIWQLGYLAELGASITNPAIRKGAEVVWNNAQGERGDFPIESKTFHKFSPEDMLCMDGIALWTLIRLGYGMDDSRASKAIGFVSQALLNAEMRCRFNANQPCAWGGMKALRALAALPVDQRNATTRSAIDKSARFFLECNLAQADFPRKPNGKISQHWFKLGFPRNYQSDLLEMAFTLADLGYATEKRFKPLVDFILYKRRPDGTWKLEETLPKMPVPLAQKGQPSRWVTWQAWYVLKAAGVENPKA
ncbi:MAG: hypothetical protein JW908_12710 [Anaerolineales bacterium]|nr:hypothetical protein [Anaerolineales bacterium]